MVKNTVDSWVNYRGEVLQPPFSFAKAEDVALGKVYDFSDLPFRDPNNFRAGNLHNHMASWKDITGNLEVLNWLEMGVNVQDYFTCFKGNFKGKSYDSPTPPHVYFPNAGNCKNHTQFIVDTLLERIKNGSMTVWGKVGCCDPPHLVMPLTVEPSKPRLCHDERFLNLWISDKPFMLNTLKDVPRVTTRWFYDLSRRQVRL